MQFESEAERLQHPKVRLIPYSIWRRRFFDETLSELELRYMEEKIDFPLPDPQNELAYLNDEKKKRLLTTLIYAHPDITPDEYIQLTNQLKIVSKEAFILATEFGRLDILDELHSSPDDELQAMISASSFQVFYVATTHGHTHVLEKLKEWAKTPDKLQAMIAADNFAAFRIAASGGHALALEKLKEWAPDKLQAMIEANNFLSFRSAVRNGQTHVIEKLKEWAPDKLQAMVEAENFAVLDNILRNENVNTLTSPLTFPSVFAYAESHAYEYQSYVTPFCTKTLNDLRTRQQEFELANPNAVFNITTPKETKLYFYIIRNLIRRNDPNLLDDIRLLLNIPAVKALAHTEVTPQNANELLLLALSVENQGAIEILIAIPAVRELAQQHDYYRAEQRGGIDLSQLAHDRESSMTALTSGEQKRLDSAIKHYQPIMQNAGTEYLMAALRETLQNRYEQHPATIEVKGEVISLPLDWQEFQKLNLNQSSKEKALEAYYQHKDHTSLRYLSKPNAWMAENASYVYVDENDRSQRWSTFEEYQPLITLFYLAANDTEINAIDGVDSSARLDQFIDELAHIGRAHNWDHSRPKIKDGKEVLDKEGKVVTEEYDDLKGDRPSCFSGVKRRLFQSVPNHPLLSMLTEEIISQELNEFIRNHFKEFAVDGLKEKITTAWNNFINDDNEENPNTGAELIPYNISPEKQQQFITSMKAKYGEELTSDLLLQIKNTFDLNERNENHPSHFAKFYGRANLDNLFPSSNNLEQKTPSNELSSHREAFFKTQEEKLKTTAGNDDPSSSPNPKKT